MHSTPFAFAPPRNLAFSRASIATPFGNAPLRSPRCDAAATRQRHERKCRRVVSDVAHVVGSTFFTEAHEQSFDPNCGAQGFLGRMGHFAYRRAKMLTRAFAPAEPRQCLAHLGAAFFALNLGCSDDSPVPGGSSGHAVDGLLEANRSVA